MAQLGSGPRALLYSLVPVALATPEEFRVGSRYNGVFPSIRLGLCLVLSLTFAMASSAVERNPSRALWVWDAAPLLQARSARQDFFDFCGERGIDTAWVQVTRTLGGNRLEHDEDWRDLLDEAHRRGVKIHALDGDPAYMLPGHDYDVLQLVDTIIRFNRDAPADRRFDGIHLDIEPHRLAGWQLPVIRERLLGDYLELNAHIQRIVRAAGGIEYGVDIPFWWQYPDDQTGAAIGDVTFNGVRKAASFHILDLVDNVGLMDYRNVARGDDGIIAHARAVLDYADGKPSKVFVGVETSPVARVELPKLTFDGRSNAEMERELALARDAFIGHQSFAGFAIHHYVPYRQRFEAEAVH